MTGRYPYNCQEFVTSVKAHFASQLRYERPGDWRARLLYLVNGVTDEGSRSVMCMRWTVHLHSDDLTISQQLFSNTRISDKSRWQLRIVIKYDAVAMCHEQHCICPDLTSDVCLRSAKSQIVHRSSGDWFQAPSSPESPPTSTFGVSLA